MDSYRAIIAAQGGDPSAELPRAVNVEDLRAPADGVLRWDAAGVGRASWLSGAGRSRPGQSVDTAAGVMLHRVEGEQVRAGEVIASVRAGDAARIPAAVAELGNALTVDASAAAPGAGGGADPGGAGADTVDSGGAGADTAVVGPAGTIVHRLRGW